MDAYPATVDYLYSLKNRGSKYGIERMERLVEALGHPHLATPVIHVAGTNGKGSTCAMLEAIYRENGYKTGLFTSPHLVHLGERIQVDRVPLSEAELLAYIDLLRPICERIAGESEDLRPTFFEVIAAMAFIHFKESKVDVAIIETGLGGRLDATNVVSPLLSLITTISLDHTELLGDTISAIAREKAGIIKKDTPVAIGYLPEAAELTIEEVARERTAPLHRLATRFPVGACLPKTNLEGNFQRRNAALATLAVELLQERLPVSSLTALNNVSWSGRWQRLRIGEQSVILDASHNPEGLIQLAENLDALCKRGGPLPVAIAGTLGLDRGRALIEVLEDRVAKLYLVAPDQERACDPEDLKALLKDPAKAEVAQLNDFFDPTGRFRLQHIGPVLVTGSIYLIGEFLAHCNQGEGRVDYRFNDRV